jgi:energy-coupling factor transporter ATP-binding protein EcfA2
MLKAITVRNLTVFPRADLECARHLNVIVGENGSGKTHLLKIAYALLAVSADEGRRLTPAPTSQAVLQVRVADKLVKVFRPEHLGHLVHRNREANPICAVEVRLDSPGMDVEFVFRKDSESEVEVRKVPAEWSPAVPVYLPTRELLSIYPNFVSVYEGRYLEFEETWRDTCVLLGAPLQKGLQEERNRELLRPFEQAMGGSLELDKNGRFYLKLNGNRLEIPLVAEGFRKMGMLARLIANGTFSGGGYLFWDEPDANLNPKLVKQVAESILSLCWAGIQTFVATHSLFLLRELEILLSSDRFRSLETRFFGLHRTGAGARVQQGSTVGDIGDIAALDEQLEQSDRFLAKER